MLLNIFSYFIVCGFYSKSGLWLWNKATSKHTSMHTRRPRLGTTRPLTKKNQKFAKAALEKCPFPAPTFFFN